MKGAGGILKIALIAIIAVIVAKLLLSKFAPGIAANV
jgi:hypothetical protein